MTEKTELLFTLGATLLGSGLGTTIVGALFKRRFHVQLESYKSVLERSSRIHERQVDALLEIHFRLERALFYLQRATSSFRFQGEASDKDLLGSMARELGAASESFSKSRLLIGPDLSRRLDEFFKRAFLAGSDLTLTMDPIMMYGGEARAQLWKQAQESAYKEIPPILDAIRIEASTLIHGQPTQH